jgi:hypothetical protein
MNTFVVILIVGGIYWLLVAASRKQTNHVPSEDTNNTSNVFEENLGNSSTENILKEDIESEINEKKVKDGDLEEHSELYMPFTLNEVDIQPPVKPKEYLYLGIPQGHFFHRVYPNHIKFETFFVLTLHDMDKTVGEFSITEDEETKKYLLTMIPATVGACEFINIPSSPSSMIIQSFGNAKFISNFWRIDKKVIINSSI